MARVKANLRRTRFDKEDTLAAPAQPENEIIRFDNLVLDLTRQEVLLDDKPLTLKPKEFDLLLYLARHRGQALSRDTILEQVWGWEYTGNSRTVDVHMSWLREKIERDPTHPVRIVTVRGTGYRFEG